MAVTAVAALGYHTMIVEPSMIQVNRIEIADTGVEMRLGLVADFQRRNADPAFVQRVVDTLNSENLDMVLIAGDFIDVSADELPSVGPLRQLNAVHGVYGVLGNHDYGVYSYSRGPADLELAGEVIEYVEEGGAVRILRNEAVQVNGVHLTGLDSYWAGLRDEGAIHPTPQDAYRILLSHNQDDLSVDHNTADLFLFGHTHCGQVRLPLAGSVAKLVGFRGEYDYRHYTVGDVDVYTTCGLTPGPRLLNPPEIAILSLR